MIEKIKTNKAFLSIRGIEKELGMPDSTLIKAVNKVQKLPKKWEKPLNDFICTLAMKDFEDLTQSEPKRRNSLRLFDIIRCFLWKIFGYCPMHGWFLYPKRYRMNTAYIND